jgi:hypothetical protein
MKLCKGPLYASNSLVYLLYYTLIIGSGFFSGLTHFESKSEPGMHELEGSALELPGPRFFFAIVRLWGTMGYTSRKMGPD